MAKTTPQQVHFPQRMCLLVSVPRDLVADDDALHQPLCVEPCVVMPHLHCGQLAQVLTLREREREILANSIKALLWFGLLFFYFGDHFWSAKWKTSSRTIIKVLKMSIFVFQTNPFGRERQQIIKISLPKPSDSLGHNTVYRPTSLF